jgi:hypothetical protein
MKKLASLLAAALVIAGCGSANDDPAQPYRDALPKTNAVEIGSPAASTTSGALTAQMSVLGDSPATQSGYAVASYYLAITINGGVRWTLGLLQYVTTFPPTGCDAASCTWGPAIDDQGLNRWKLVVTRVNDHYDYTLQGQPGSNASAAWVDLIAGTAYPGADRDHGHGTFTVDFDAQDALDHGPLWHKTDYGRLDVTYDNTTSPVAVGARFVGAHNQDPLDPFTMNAAYAFERGASGGDLQVAFQRLDTMATLSLHTRWSASGAGRGDAHYHGPDGTGTIVDYSASECWAGAVQDFAEVYDSKPPVLGSETACSPFNSAVYADIALP